MKSHRKTIASLTTIHRLLGILIILGLGLAASGCVAVVAGGAGAGTVAYVRGDLNATLEAPLDRTRTAIRRAVENLEFREINENFDALSGRLIARTAQDRRITINAKAATDRTSEISIRVGTFGDEALSQRILEEIRRAL